MARRQTHDDFDPDDPDDDLDVLEGGEDATPRDTGYCPDCGAEIYDAAEICPKCFAWIDGETSRHSPRCRRAADRRTRLVVWALIAAISTGLGFFALVGLVR